MPSRIFPWVGIGYPVLTMILIPGIAILMVYLGGRHPIFFEGSIYHTVLVLLVLVQVAALVWGTVHAARLAGVRRRMAGSLEGVVPPPAEYINRVQLDDAAFYRRDDRAPVVQKLAAVQAGLLWFLDDFATDPDQPWTASTDDDQRADFHKRRQPRRAMLASAILLTIVWVGLTVLMFFVGDWVTSTPGILILITALGLPLLVLLYVIGGLRNSLDNRFRRRIMWLRWEVEAARRRS